MSTWIEFFSDNIIILGAFTVASGTILFRLKNIYKWFKLRFQLFLSKTMQDSIKKEIQEADKSNQIVDSIAHLQMEVHNLSNQHTEVVEKVDKLTSEIAINRELGKERSDHAATRIDSLEANLTMMFEAVLQVVPGRTAFYAPRDVTERD